MRSLPSPRAFGAWAIDAAVRAGIGAVGENYAQECVAKLAEVSVDPLPQVHFIGGLQRNKVKRLAGLVDVWQSVDTAALAAEIAKRAPQAHVMIQVNISGEAQKGGCERSEVEGLVSEAVELGLTVEGLMGIGPMAEPEDARPGFRELRRLVDVLGLAHCSMGMSADLEIAVQEGATVVRIGSDLFGPRPKKSTDERHT